MESSQAQATFLEGIKDAENLLAQFDKLNRSHAWRRYAREDKSSRNRSF